MDVKIILPFLVLAICGQAYGQAKYEREFRILKEQFPDSALVLLKGKIESAKRIKYYKEIDSAKTSYEAKFKKDRLWYSVEFDAKGGLEDVEILIKPIDIPSDTYAKIIGYLDGMFSKYKMKRMQQQYPKKEGEAPETVLKRAFQNLLLPSLNYELVVAAKDGKDYKQYEILFDATGTFLTQRESLPPNYDHVLY